VPVFSCFLLSEEIIEKKEEASVKEQALSVCIIAMGDDG
jgi:hypothetical protein